MKRRRCKTRLAKTYRLLLPLFASFLSNSADLGTKLLLEPSAHLSFSSGVHQMQLPSPLILELTLSLVNLEIEPILTSLPNQTQHNELAQSHHNCIDTWACRTASATIASRFILLTICIQTLLQDNNTLT